MNNRKQYWNAHLKILAVLLLCWFVLGTGLPVLLVDELNTIRIAGFPLGFWLAFQGVFILFPVLAFIYVYLMNRLDKKYGFEEK